MMKMDISHFSKEMQQVTLILGPLPFFLYKYTILLLLLLLKYNIEITNLNRFKKLGFQVTLLLLPPLILLLPTVTDGTSTQF